MLGKLFNADQRRTQRYVKQLDQGNTEQRLALLAQLRDAQSSGQLQQISPALQDSINILLARQDDVTLAARLITWANDLDALTTLLAHESLAGAAAKRIIELNPYPSSATDHPEIVAARIKHASPEHVSTLLPLAKTPEQLATLAIRARGKDRELLLDQPILRSEQGLMALEKCSRGHDKACHKHARERLEAIKTARRDTEQALQRLDEIDATIAKTLAKHKEQRLDLESLRQHKTRLRLLDDKRRAALAELKRATESLQHVDTAAAVVEPGMDPLADFDLNLPDSNDDAYARVIVAVEAFILNAQQASNTADEVAAALRQAHEDWLAVDVEYAASQSQQHAFEHASTLLSRYAKCLTEFDNLDLDFSVVATAMSASEIAQAPVALIQQRQRWLKNTTKALSKLSWPKTVPMPKQLHDIEAVTARVQTEVEKLLEHQSKSREQVKDSVRRARDLLTQGQLKQATQYLADARALQKLGYREHDGEIAQLSAELDEMSDWQNFVTEPKRQALLSGLRSLVEEPLAPPDQAERLKHLRQSWNELGRLGRTQQGLQKHFDDLAEQAFAPCKAYFSDQADHRAKNLQRRQALCQQLSDFLAQADWQQTGLRELESISRQARAEWRSHHPCEHRALKPVEKHFEALQQQIHDHIRQCKRDNLEQKRQLVATAEALTEVDANADATQQAKLLQQRWKQIGPAPRKDEHRVWQAFRHACDQVFQRRAAAYQASKDAHAAQLTVLSSALDEFEQSSSDADLGALRKRYQAIEEQTVDVKLDASTRNRLQAAAQIIANRAKAARRSQLVERLEQWRLWDLTVSQAEQTGNNIDAPHPIFADRCKGLGHSEDLTRLTLEAEIAADIQSPVADQQQRMALQIELINQGLNNTALINNQQFIDRWCRSGPKASADDDLRSRFFAALTQRLPD